MKRDLDVVLKDAYGKTFKDELTLGEAMALAIAARLPEDAHQTLEQRMVLYRLLQRVIQGGVQEFEAGELDTIKRRGVSDFQLTGLGAMADALDADYVPSK